MKQIRIGLTGNIATGKSAIRQLLENCGAFTIDADALVHRLLYQDGAAYPAIVAHFGKGILTPAGDIARNRLAEIVFNQPEALAILENITHPLVIATVQKMLAASTHPVQVVEAIKLVESGLASQYDAVWVSTVAFSAQMQRLMLTRGMNEATARLRIISQPDETIKLNLATHVINTSGSYQQNFDQIVQGLKALGAGALLDAHPVQPLAAGWTLQQIHPAHLPCLATFTALNPALQNDEHLYQALSQHSLLLMRQDNQPAALIQVQRNNFAFFVGRLQQVPAIPIPACCWQACLIQLENFAASQQCEVMFINPQLSLPLSSAYTHQTIKTLAQPGWAETCHRFDASLATIYYRELSS